MTIAAHKPARSAAETPYYRAVGNEVEVFRAAARRGLPVLLKGPTGCGKTRFVEAMAENNSWDHSAEQYEHLYLEAYQRRRGHPFEE